MNIRSILADPGFYALKEFIVGHTGLNYYADKDEDLGTRLARRLSARNLTSCAEYLRLLNGESSGASEMESLIGELTIGETYFFRQTEHFDLLRATILPDLLRRKHDVRQLRIWSAGCATGAEPYSVSMVLRREFAQELAGWDVSILATDINVDFLALARQATYGEWALRETPEPVRQLCFNKTGRSWQLKAQFREGITFRYHNLAADESWPGQVGDLPIDLIFCRNVMIYFSRDCIRSVVNHFHDSLAPGGWLLVGHAEPHGETFRDFELVSDTRVTAYRKKLPASVQPEPSPAYTPPEWEPTFPIPSRTVVPARSQVPSPDLTERIAASPSRDNPSLILETVRMLADRGEWKEAAQLCHGLLNDNALNAPAHFTLGLIRAHTLSTEEAQAAFRRAIYLDRSFTMAHYHLGVALQKLGQGLQARKSFRNVLSLIAGSLGEEMVPWGDGITAEELRDLTGMHLQAMEGQS